MHESGFSPGAYRPLKPTKHGAGFRVYDSLEETSDPALGKQLSLKLDSGVGLIRRHVKMRHR